MPKKKPKNHPKHMTTEEAMKHLFHPEVIEHVKKHAHGSEHQKKKGT